MSLGIADVGVVYEETFEARNKWQNILLKLGVGIDTITSISIECRDKPDDCYRRGLEEWLKSEGRHWRDIVKALSSPIVGHHAIANKIERERLSKDAVANSEVFSIPAQESQSTVSEHQPSTILDK